MAFSQLNRRILWLEVAILLALVLYYEIGTFLFRADPSQAHAAALWLWNTEAKMGLDVEVGFQAFFDTHPFLLGLLIFFYVGPHFFLTLGFIAWSYWFRFPSYPHVRNAMAAYTLLAFGFQWLVPVSPPRLVPESGLIDSVDVTLPVSGQTAWVQTFANSYAALPSVHFGWALLIALLAIRLLKGPHRWWWLLYPGIIAISILATGNHWVLDIFLAGVFILGTECLLAVVEQRRWTRHYVNPLAAAPKPVAESV